MACSWHSAIALNTLGKKTYTIKHEVCEYVRFSVVIGSGPKFHSFRSEINKFLLRHQVPATVTDTLRAMAMRMTSVLKISTKSKMEVILSSSV